MTAIRRFEDIEAWQLVRQLAKRVHAAASQGSFLKDYPLKDQIERSTGSIMDNIAEGFDGGSHAEFARFLAYAQRSATETQSQLYRALDRGHMDNDSFNALYGLTRQVRSKIGAFIKYLKASPGQVRDEGVEYCAPSAPHQARRTKHKARRTTNETP